MSEIAANDPDALLTAEEVARMLGVTVAWVYAQSRSRRIPTVTLGRYRRYRRTAIESRVGGIEDRSVRTGGRFAPTA